MACGFGNWRSTSLWAAAVFMVSAAPALAAGDWEPTTVAEHGQAAWALHVMLCGDGETLGPATAEQCEASLNASLQYLSILIALERVQTGAGQPVSLPPFPDFGAEVNARIMTLAPTLTPEWRPESATSMEAAPVSIAESSARALGMSYGMAQRLNIAAALIADPPVLIMDEPTTGLDTGSVTDDTTVDLPEGTAATEDATPAAAPTD